MDLHLTTTAPCTGEYTVQVAEGLAECVRVLNHLSLSDDAFPDPQTVYAVLGSLRAAAELDQLLQQIARRLEAMARLDRLGDDRGNPWASVLAVGGALGSARTAASALAGSLHRAHNSTATLRLRTTEAGQ